MATNPRNVQGSDADRAEGGLDVEAAYADVDGQTAARMAHEAENNGPQPEAQPHRKEPQGMNRAQGTPAMEMLTSHVEGGLQEAPNVGEGYTYAGPDE